MEWCFSLQSPSREGVCGCVTNFNRKKNAFFFVSAGCVYVPFGSFLPASSRHPFFSQKCWMPLPVGRRGCCCIGAGVAPHAPPPPPAATSPAATGMRSRRYASSDAVPLSSTPRRIVFRGFPLMFREDSVVIRPISGGTDVRSLFDRSRCTTAGSSFSTPAGTDPIRLPPSASVVTDAGTEGSAPSALSPSMTVSSLRSPARAPESAAMRFCERSRYDRLSRRPKPSGMRVKALRHSSTCVSPRSSKNSAGRARSDSALLFSSRCVRFAIQPISRGSGADILCPLQRKMLTESWCSNSSRGTSAKHGVCARFEMSYTPFATTALALFASKSWRACSSWLTAVSARRLSRYLRMATVPLDSTSRRMLLMGLPSTFRVERRFRSHRHTGREGRSLLLTFRCCSAGSVAATATSRSLLSRTSSTLRPGVSRRSRETMPLYDSTSSRSDSLATAPTSVSLFWCTSTLVSRRLSGSSGKAVSAFLLTSRSDRRVSSTSDCGVSRSLLPDTCSVCSAEHPPRLSGSAVSAQFAARSVLRLCRLPRAPGRAVREGLFDRSSSCRFAAMHRSGGTDTSALPAALRRARAGRRKRRGGSVERRFSSRSTDCSDPSSGRSSMLSGSAVSALWLTSRRTTSHSSYHRLFSYSSVSRRVNSSGSALRPRELRASAPFCRARTMASFIRTPPPLTAMPPLPRWKAGLRRRGCCIVFVFFAMKYRYCSF
eukprot:Rhum_TRINITY_DN4554_c0_g1::Rhum_TRINITY_DN4554_c0_g1_i1::g.14786::m.14786